MKLQRNSFLKLPLRGIFICAELVLGVPGKTYSWERGHLARMLPVV